MCIVKIRIYRNHRNLNVTISELVRLLSWLILFLEASSAFQVLKKISYVCFSISSPYTEGKYKMHMKPEFLVCLMKTKFKSVGGIETMLILGWL